MRLAAMMYESCLWQDAYIVCYWELLPVFCLISSPTEGVGISQILDENLALPLSRSLAMLFSLICLTRSRVRPSWSLFPQGPFPDILYRSIRG